MSTGLGFKAADNCMVRNVPDLAEEGLSMSRKVLTVLLSGALAFSSVSTSAWSATDASGTVLPQSAQTNHQTGSQAPLPPAGAAGIKQAQGLVHDFPLLSIAIGAGIVSLVWIWLDNDDATGSTGTH